MTAAPEEEIFAFADINQLLSFTVIDYQHVLLEQIDLPFASSSRTPPIFGKDTLFVPHGYGCFVE